MHLLVIMRLGQAKAHDKLIPLLGAKTVHKVTLVRHARVDLNSSKLIQKTHSVGMDKDGFTNSWLSYVGNVWACFFDSLRVAIRERPQVVLAFNFVPYGLIAWLVARLTGRYCIVSMIGSDYHTWLKSWHVGPILKLFLRNCDTVTIFGEVARADLKSMSVAPERLFVLPNTFNTSLFYPDISIEPVWDIMYVGALRPLKQVDLLIRSLAVIHDTRPGTTLCIVGEGRERANLEALATSLGLGSSVDFYGWSDSTVTLLRQSRVFSSLSRAEGLPVAMLEAMATGLPVVMTDVGAINTVVKDGVNGYLVQPDDAPEAVASRLLRLLDDTAHHDVVREAALKMGQSHGYENTTAVWDDILGSLLGVPDEPVEATASTFRDETRL